MIQRATYVLAAALLFAADCREVLADAAAPPAAVERSDLFAAGEGGYMTYRIPGIAQTARGTLLAWCEARKSGTGDWEDIDVLMRRSTDGGKTWSEPQLLADAGTATANNPVMIAARDGAVHFLHCVDYARCYYRRSDDDGRTFSAPVEITDTFKRFSADYDWNVIATGPGHGIELRGGRLLVPVWLSTGGKQHRPSSVASIYSDDRGKTWQRGDIIARTEQFKNPSETIALELTDGRVMFNIRHEDKSHRRAVAFSPDGATCWTAPVLDDQLFEPICFASIIRAAGGEVIFANPDSRDVPTTKPAGVNRSRENLTLRLSSDDGKTWPVRKVLDPGLAGYSDLAASSDGAIYCFYERGGVKRNAYYTSTLTLARFKIAWLRSVPDSK